MAEKITSDDRHKQDFDDLQHEMSGTDNGRVKRFLHENANSIEAKRKEREATAQFNRLLDLLNDPVYRAKYEEAFSKLEAAEQATEAALSKLSVLIEQAETDLKDIEGRAARLPDGTKVFKDQDGLVLKEDGSVVEQHLIDTIIWNENNPSYEDYTNVKAKLNDFQDQYNEVQYYQTNTLGDVRNRLEDEESPQSLDGLNGIINDIETEMPDIVSQHLPQSSDLPSPDATITMDVVPEIPIKP